MEEEFEINEEQVEEVVSTDDTVPASKGTDDFLHLTHVPNESKDSAYDDAEAYIGDDDSTSINNSQEVDEVKMGSLDCRSECKYNTGSTYKYANYGYSD